MALFWHRCREYRRAMEGMGWSVERLKSIQSIEEFPFLPILYFKHHQMHSMSMKKMLTTATSSGTSGNKSVIGYDVKSLWKGLGMVLSVGISSEKLLQDCGSGKGSLGESYVRS